MAVAHSAITLSNTVFSGIFMRTNFCLSAAGSHLPSKCAFALDSEQRVHECDMQNCRTQLTSGLDWISFSKQ